jgi:hypothetical protein
MLIRIATETVSLPISGTGRWMEAGTVLKWETNGQKMFDNASNMMG